MDSWQPQQEGLNELLQLLQGSMSSDSAIQAHRLDYLVENVTDYCNYLVYVLTQHRSSQVSVRAVSGILLKNVLKLRYPRLPAASKEYVKAWILEGVMDSERDVRSAAGSVLSMLILNEPIEAWPQSVDRLVQMLESNVPEHAHGALDALNKVLEDAPTRLISADIGGQKPLSFIIPRAVRLMDSQDARTRVLSIKMFNSLLWARTEQLTPFMPAFSDALFRRAATDDHPEVQRTVCQTMASMIENAPDSLMPQMNAVLDYMTQRTADEDDAIALEACEFWMSFAEMEDTREMLATRLPQLIPLLMRRLVFGEMELLMMDDAEDDESVPDRAEDVKPWHGKSKKHGEGGGNEESDEEEEEDDDDDMFEDWTLRKCAAATLDTLAGSFGSGILPILLPILNHQLQSDDWLVRESGILALGAIAEGCQQGIEPSLPVFIPYLLQSLQHPKPLVRAIACWTLSRYAVWVTEIPQEEERNKYFVPIVRGFLHMCRDNNKKVQSAGCSAFAQFTEEAGSLLVPHLPEVIPTLAYCFDKYQRKNLFLLYDTLGTLADMVRRALNVPEYTAIIIPRLYNKWRYYSDEDPDLEALLECMSSMVTAMGPAFGEFIPEIWQRCVNIIQQVVTMDIAYRNDPANTEMPETGMLIAAMDLISGICQGLKGDAASLLMQSNPPILPMMQITMTSSVPSVRQSAMALIGDISMWCYDALKPHLGQFVPLLIENIRNHDPDLLSVCNNAAWASGEVALRALGDIKPFIPALMEKLIPIMMDPNTTRMLAENVSVAIGRLGCACPDVLAPSLDTYAHTWCARMKSVLDNNEKLSACLGMNQIIKANPQGLVNAFQMYCEMVVSWEATPQQLAEEYQQILTGYKSMISDWEQYASSFSLQTRHKLKERYGL